MLFADQALGRRVEQHEAANALGTVEAIARLWPETGACSLRVGEGVAVFTGKRGYLNRALGLGLNGPLDEAMLDTVEAFYQELGMPAQVEVSTLADPSLIEGLGARGYRLTRFFHKLIRPLTPEDAGLEPPPGVQVLPITPDSPEAEVWVETVARGFAPDETQPLDELSLRWTRLALHLPHVRLFLALVGDEPAGGGAMVLHSGLASLFSTSTRAALRRRGVQHALLHARLAAAAAAGGEAVHVMTLPGNASQHNVERVGFRLAYGKAVLTQG